MRRPPLWAATVTTLITSALLLSGCAPKAPPPDPIAPPATPDTVRAIRQAYTSRDPSTVVGLVIAVLPESNLAAVGDVPVNQFQSGQLVTFIDSNQDIIAIGNVVNMTADAVHVKYQPQGDRPRAPREGDLAVKTQS